MEKLVFLFCLLALCGTAYSEDIAPAHVTTTNKASTAVASTASQGTTVADTTTNQASTAVKSTASQSTTVADTTTNQASTAVKSTASQSTTVADTTTNQASTAVKSTASQSTTVSEPTMNTTGTINPATSPSTLTSASPTEKPFPSNYPAENQYVVRENNETCLLANLTVQFENTYNGDVVNVTEHAIVDEDRSSCSILAVKFGNNSFSLTFINQSSNYNLDQVEANINGDEGNATHLKRAQTKLWGSYICMAGLNISMNNNFSFVATNVQFQAFVTTNGTFGTATNCKSDLSPIIPIVVGAVLAVLVVLVIIAYLIGRRRSRSGYEEI